MTRTVQVTLDITEDEHKRLGETLSVYAKVFNKHAKWAQENRSVSKTKAHKELYFPLREKYPGLPSAMLQCARDHAIGAVKSYNSNNPKKRWGKKISYTAQSARYNQRTVSLNTKGILTFSLFGGKRGKSYISIPKFFSDRYGDWEFNSATIGIDRNGRAFANLSFRKTVAEKKTNGGIVGIDRGIYNIATTSKGKNFSSKTVRGRKRQLLHNRSTLQAKVAQKSRSASRRLASQRGKEARFSKNELDIITKSLSLDQSVKTYVLEDLSGLHGQRKSKNFNRLKNTWSPAQFEFLLKYKCEQQGIEVVSVDPKYTSQQCNSCGTIEKKNRKKDKFSCIKCGYKNHADVNAALNIRDKHISTLVC